jgi:Family of unknown function (DUF6941)
VRWGQSEPPSGALSKTRGVKLDWIMLANYAEIAPSGLITVVGGTWDTMTVHTPLSDDAPEDTVALLTGCVVVRALFHVTETGRDHEFTLTAMDEDGGEVARIDGGLRVERQPDLPPGWDQGVNLVISLNGMPIPRFGLYSISLQIDGQHVGDRSFRVVDGS